MTPYQYAANNPILIIDINGDSTFVTQNDDGTYTVKGGNLSGSEDDTGVYVRNDDGSLTLIGNSVTTHSFVDENGKFVSGAVIDLGSSEGQNFINGLMSDDPGLIEYMLNATNTEDLDFKYQGIKKRSEGITEKQHMYRGSVTKNGAIGSARDFGNIGAGIVAGRRGLKWSTAKIGFDVYQSIKSRRITTECQATQKAQRVGHNIGLKLWISKLRIPKNSWK